MNRNQLYALGVKSMLGLRPVPAKHTTNTTQAFWNVFVFSWLMVLVGDGGTRQ